MVLVNKLKLLKIILQHASGFWLSITFWIQHIVDQETTILNHNYDTSNDPSIEFDQLCGTQLFVEELEYCGQLAHKKPLSCKSKQNLHLFIFDFELNSLEEIIVRKYKIENKKINLPKVERETTRYSVICFEVVDDGPETTWASRWCSIL